VTRFAGGPAESPGFVLWHLTLLWQRRIATVLAPMDLTHAQFVLLACTWWLCETGEQPNQRQVAQQAGTDAAMTSQVLRTLERKGLVERAVDPHDSRARRLRPTAAGLSLARDAVVAVEAVDAEVFGDGAGDLVAALHRIDRDLHPAEPDAGSAVEKDEQRQKEK
jgi:DNA-binding MarR family transcriptional regulator